MVRTLEFESGGNIDELGVDPALVYLQEYRPLIREVGIESSRSISGGLRNPVGVGTVKAIGVKNLGCRFHEQAPAFLGIARFARLPGQGGARIISHGVLQLRDRLAVSSAMCRISEGSSWASLQRVVALHPLPDDQSDPTPGRRMNL
jgi:hypothetical protein